MDPLGFSISTDPGDPGPSLNGGFWDWFLLGYSTQVSSQEIYLGSLSNQLLTVVDDNASPELFETNPDLGYSANAYGDVEFNSINWTLACQNADYFQATFDEAADAAELARNCPTIGPTTIPCAVIRGGALAIAAAAALESIIQMSRSQSNQADTGIMDEIQQDKFRMNTQCQALQHLLNEAKKCRGHC